MITSTHNCQLLRLGMAADTRSCESGTMRVQRENCCLFQAFALAVTRCVFPIRPMAQPCRSASLKRCEESPPPPRRFGERGSWRRRSCGTRELYGCTGGVGTSHISFPRQAVCYAQPARLFWVLQAALRSKLIIAAAQPPKTRTPVNLRRNAALLSPLSPTCTVPFVLG